MLAGALGTGKVWGSVPPGWEVFGERYKRLGFDDTLKLGV